MFQSLGSWHSEVGQYIVYPIIMIRFWSCQMSYSCEVFMLIFSVWFFIQTNNKTLNISPSFGPILVIVYKRVEAVGVIGGCSRWRMTSHCTVGHCVQITMNLEKTQYFSVIKIKEQLNRYLNILFEVTVYSPDVFTAVSMVTVWQSLVCERN